MADDGLEDAMTHPLRESSPAGKPTSVSYGAVTVTERLVVQEENGTRTTIPLGQVTSLEKVTVREAWPGIVAVLFGVGSALALFSFVEAPEPAMGVTAGVLAVMALGFLIWWAINERSSLTIKSPTDEIHVPADGTAGYDAGRLMAEVERRV